MKKKSIAQMPRFDDVNSSERKCDEKGCDEQGNYFAPKSPNNKEKYVFCLEHIKKYNKRWDYFAGKSQNDIYEFQKNGSFEDRPTKPFFSGSSSKIKFQFEYSLDKSKIKFSKRTKRFEKTYKYSLNNEIENSLRIFGLDSESGQDNLKKTYKELVKKYHPDLNKDYLNKETKIKEINRAYKVLLKFYKQKKC